MAHLWTGATAPVEYIEFILCRDVYHCTPSQLRQERTTDLLMHIHILSVESEVKRLRGRKGRR